MKRCSKCGEEFPATNQFFALAKRNKDGLKSQCKVCKSKQDKAYKSRPEIQEHRQSSSKEYYSRPEVQKHENARRKVYRKAYYRRSQVQEHKRIHSKAYRSRPEIQEREHAYKTIYNSRPEIQEHKRTRDKAYSSRPEVQRQRIVHAHNRRARQKAIPGTHTAQDIQEQYDRQRGTCYWCHKKLEKYHVDHIIPLVRGGSNDPDNLVIACPHCNLSKNKKLPHE